MPLQPDLNAFIDKIKQEGFPDISQMTPIDARIAVDQGRFALLPVNHCSEVLIRNQFILHENILLPIRIYSPQNQTSSLPGIVFFHGGGFVLGDLNEYDTFCIALTKQAQCVTVSLAYRLAPEFPFPTAIEDCYYASKWVASHAASLQILPNNLFICGESSGGCLAAVVALMVRDRKQFHLQGQILIYPVTDNNFNTTSYLQYADGALSRQTLIWFWQHYAKENEMNSPYAAPLKSKNLNDLAPALVITAECDPLHDEGAAYAERLRNTRCLYDYYCFKGMSHAFIIYAQVVSSAQAATQDLIKRISKMINKTVIG